MKPAVCVATIAVIVVMPLLSGAAHAAKRDADDPRRKCREAIQKSTGVGKDAKVSRKAIDRCIANGGLA